MDTLALGIFCGSLLICALLAYAMITYGFQGISYDEAIAGRRVTVVKKHHDGTKKKKNKKGDRKKSTNNDLLLIKDVDDNSSTAATDESPSISPVNDELSQLLDSSNVDQPSIIDLPIDEDVLKVIEAAPIPLPAFERSKVPLNSSSVIDDTVDAAVLPAKESEKVPIPVLQPNGVIPKRFKAKELMDAVRKANLKGEQVQELVDYLLDKHSATCNGGEWIEKSAARGGNEVKHLQKQLAEALASLTAEKERSKTVTDRLAVQRIELNAAKSAASASKSIISGLQNEKHESFSSFQSRLSTEVEQHNKAMVSLQLQAQRRVASLESKVEQSNLHVQSITTQHETAIISLLSESEELKGQKDKSENQVIKYEGDVNQLKQMLSQQNQSAQSRSVSMAERISFLENECIMYREAAEKLSVVKQVDYSKCPRCIYTLSEAQSSKELLTEVEAAMCILEVEKDADLVKNQGLLADRNRLQHELDDINIRHTTLLNNEQVDQLDLQSKLDDSVKLAITQQEKNDELRMKNRKVMEALEEAENTNFLLKSKTTEKVPLSSCFGMIDIGDLESFFGKLNPPLSVFARDHESSEAWLVALQASYGEAIEGSKEDARKQVIHYKNVLSQTEKILHNLESRVVSEERVWKERSNMSASNRVQDECSSEVGLTDGIKLMSDTLDDVQSRFSVNQNQVEEMKVLCDNLNYQASTSSA